MTHMYGFNGVLSIIWVEEVQMMKDKQRDGKGLLLGLKVF